MSSSEFHYVGHDWLPPWDGTRYAANTGHHRRYDAAFLETLPLRPGDRVLDLGCGSGDFTAVVAGLVPEGCVVGIDPQPTMIAEALAHARPNQSFVELRAQDVGSHDWGDDRPFDVVMSRAVLQWIPFADHRPIAAAALELLRPGGVLRVEAGGEGNVEEVVDYLHPLASRYGPVQVPWTFAGAGRWLDLLLDTGYHVDDGFVRLNAQRRPFDRGTLHGWMDSQGLQGYEAQLGPGAAAAFRSEALAGIDALRRPDGSYDLTFVRLDVLAFAPG